MYLYHESYQCWLGVMLHPFWTQQTSLHNFLQIPYTLDTFSHLETVHKYKKLPFSLPKKTSLIFLFYFLWKHPLNWHDKFWMHLEARLNKIASAWHWHTNVWIWSIIQLGHVLNHVNYYSFIILFKEKLHSSFMIIRIM